MSSPQTRSSCPAPAAVSAPFSRTMPALPEWQWCRRWQLLLARIADGDEQAHRIFLNDLGFWVDKVYLGNQRLCAHHEVVSSIVATIDAQRFSYVPGSPALSWVRAIADYRLGHPEPSALFSAPSYALWRRALLDMSARAIGRFARRIGF